MLGAEVGLCMEGMSLVQVIPLLQNLPLPVLISGEETTFRAHCLMKDFRNEDADLQLVFTSTEA